MSRSLSASAAYSQSSDRKLSQGNSAERREHLSTQNNSEPFSGINENQGVSETSQPTSPPYRALMITGLVVIFAFFSLIGWQAYINAEREAIAEGEELAEETLALQIELLSGVLEKYRMLPPLMARQPKIHRLFKTAINAKATTIVEHEVPTTLDLDTDILRPELLELVHLSGAKDVGFYDLNGNPLTSGRHLFRGNLADFDGSLLVAPLQGRLGRALVTSTGGVISYAFASIVKEAGSALGIIVFFVDLEPIEQTWALSRLPIAVFDEQNVIVISNRRELLGQNLQTIRRVRGERIFYNLDQRWRRRVEAVKEIPRLNWRMEVISELPGLRERQNSALSSTLLLAIAVAALYVVLVRRRQSQYLSNLRVQENAIRLERLVKQRTRDLSASNTHLQQEVEERKQAEAKLVTTQKELVHTAKLAVIGQMSTTLSHEFNQPLAAVRTYAENASKLQSMEKFDAVSENLSRIISQVDRMGVLSKTLMSFARKPEAEVKPVPLRLCLDEVLMILCPRAKKLQIIIEDLADCDDLWVLGVQVQVTQVLINVINNALDAVAGLGQAELSRSHQQGRVQISCSLASQPDQKSGLDQSKISEQNQNLSHETPKDPNYVIIGIHDNGPGIPNHQRETIFEPFFTTKTSGFGLGIGLSVVSGIVNDLHGKIWVDDSPLGGALISLALVATESPTQSQSESIVINEGLPHV